MFSGRAGAVLAVGRPGRPFSDTRVARLDEETGDIPTHKIAAAVMAKGSEASR
jgi:hypothetical protein